VRLKWDSLEGKDLSYSVMDAKRDTGKGIS
jgi:hypothetical protein